jgi:uncharacterized phage-like protein YoqJ
LLVALKSFKRRQVKILKEFALLWFLIFGSVGVEPCAAVISEALHFRKNVLSFKIVFI